jgi:hypothetical protein
MRLEESQGEGWAYLVCSSARDAVHFLRRVDLYICLVFMTGMVREVTTPATHSQSE